MDCRGYYFSVFEQCERIFRILSCFGARQIFGDFCSVEIAHRWLIFLRKRTFVDAMFDISP